MTAGVKAVVSLHLRKKLGVEAGASWVGEASARFELKSVVIGREGDLG
jgi:hypothetical protein